MNFHESTTSNFSLEEDFDYSIKIVIIGESNVGKTTLLHRFLTKTFKNDTKATLGLESHYFIYEKKPKIIQNPKTDEIKEREIDIKVSNENIKQETSKRIKINFCDTAGQERFHSTTTSLFKNSNGIILVYDVTNRKSFEKINYWLKKIFDNSNENIKILLVGNKIDLKEKREITNNEIESFLEGKNNNNIFFLETSALTNENNCVDKAFESVIEYACEDIFHKGKEIEDSIFEEAKGSILKLRKKKRKKKKQEVKKSCC